MGLDFETPSADRLEYFIKARGMTSRQLSKLVWDDKTHRDVLDELIKKPDPRSSTLVKICRLLEIPLDCLFQKSDTDRDILILEGNISDVKSSYNNSELINLKAENIALKMLMTEKDNRIEDLKKFNNDLFARIDEVSKLGQNSDSNPDKNK